MAEGTIKQITTRGFGIIDDGTGTDMRFNVTSVEGTPYEQLREGHRVCFNVGHGPQGPLAENVRKV